jgi:hypothetical protein
MQVLRSLLAGGAMLASVGVASAADPTLLTEEQLDGVTAGFVVTIPVVTIPIVQQGQQFNYAGFQTLTNFD